MSILFCFFYNHTKKCADMASLAGLHIKNNSIVENQLWIKTSAAAPVPTIFGSVFCALAIPRYHYHSLLSSDVMAHDIVNGLIHFSIFEVVASSQIFPLLHLHPNAPHRLCGPCGNIPCGIALQNYHFSFTLPKKLFNTPFKNPYIMLRHLYKK